MNFLGIFKEYRNMFLCVILVVIYLFIYLLIYLFLQVFHSLNFYLFQGFFHDVCPVSGACTKLRF